jgi:hypothetical protein
MKKILALAFLLAASSLSAASSNDAQADIEPTLVGDKIAMEKLRGPDGITLQWIGWDQRGDVQVEQRGKSLYLKGVQQQDGGKGRLELDGHILAVFTKSFIFKGRIAITDTPDEGRSCIRDGVYEFKITQKRKYWRLQQMEVCDGLTDYVDIYF